MQYKLINKHSGKDLIQTNQLICHFLFNHLDQFVDKEEDILKALDFVFDKTRGGNIILGLNGQEIIGAVVLNETGMSGYIPENILVYIAVHKSHRGKGYGKDLMKQAIAVTKGNIALHVEPENPAKLLYEKLGFTNKYLEMRLQKN